ncbi:hypothetical protein DPMN_113897 [Dreissena polymorpha]|uniref:Uncharacterized protein n=1 Tax=Dreissena polymorpha TaxID=45954 RepID=A0A9D4QRG3_DREPO|nr:hypothetical protein DPMN_113897 [Dreissena polymorpha]
MSSQSGLTICPHSLDSPSVLTVWTHHLSSQSGLTICPHSLDSPSVLTVWTVRMRRLGLSYARRILHETNFRLTRVI